MGDTNETELTTLGAAGAVANVASLNEVQLRSVAGRLLAPTERIAGQDCTLLTTTSDRYDLDEESGELRVGVLVEVALHSAGDGEPSEAEKFVEVTIEYDLHYRLSALPPEESREMYLSAFAEVNGPYNAWPYVRELVQSTVSRMGLPPLVLPLFRVNKDPQEKAEEAPRLRVVGN